MESLTIKRQVTVKIKVTEDFKKKMALQMQDTVRSLDLEIQNIDFQMKRAAVEMEKHNPHPQQAGAARQHLEEQKQKRVRAKEQLMEQIKNLGKLAIGAEVVQGTLDTIAEIRVGDNWQDIFGVELIVCDDRIVEIRRGTKND